MLTSMTLAEIQTKYSGIHTPEEIEQFHQNMDTSKKWKVVKNEWTWDGLNHVQLRGRALQYHPSLDMMELYKEHPYKTALRLVPKEEDLEDSGDEESVADSDLEEEDGERKSLRVHTRKMLPQRLLRRHHSFQRFPRRR